MKCKHSQIYMTTLCKKVSLWWQGKNSITGKVLHELRLQRKGWGRIVREFGIDMLLLFLVAKPY